VAVLVTVAVLSWTAGVWVTVGVSVGVAVSGAWVTVGVLVGVAVSGAGAAPMTIDGLAGEIVTPLIAPAFTSVTFPLVRVNGDVPLASALKVKVASIPVPLEPELASWPVSTRPPG